MSIISEHATTLEMVENSNRLCMIGEHLVVLGINTCNPIMLSTWNPLILPETSNTFGGMCKHTYPVGQTGQALSMRQSLSIYGRQVLLQICRPPYHI